MLCMHATQRGPQRAATQQKNNELTGRLLMKATLLCRQITAVHAPGSGGRREVRVRALHEERTAGARVQAGCSAAAPGSMHARRG